MKGRPRERRSRGAQSPPPPQRLLETGSYCPSSRLHSYRTLSSRSTFASDVLLSPSCNRDQTPFDLYPIGYLSDRCQRFERLAPKHREEMTCQGRNGSEVARANPFTHLPSCVDSSCAAVIFYILLGPTNSDEPTPDLSGPLFQIETQSLCVRLPIMYPHDKVCSHLETIAYLAMFPWESRIW